MRKDKGLNGDLDRLPMLLRCCGRGAMSMMPSRCPVCRRILVLSTQQLLDFIPTQRGGKFFLAADGGLDDLALAVLQRQDLFLDRVASDELVAGHDFGLADAVRARR